MDVPVNFDPGEIRRIADTETVRDLRNFGVMFDPSSPIYVGAGTSVVYKGVDKRSDQFVAVKIDINSATLKPLKTFLEKHKGFHWQSTAGIDPAIGYETLTFRFPRVFTYPGIPKFTEGRTIVTEFINGKPLADPSIDPKVKWAIIKGYVGLLNFFTETEGIELDSNISTDLIFVEKDGIGEVIHVDPMEHRPHPITVSQIIDDGLETLPNDPRLLELKSMNLRSLTELHVQMSSL